MIFSKLLITSALHALALALNDYCPTELVNEVNAPVRINGNTILSPYFKHYLKTSNGILIVTSTMYANDPSFLYGMRNAFYTVESMCKATSDLCSALGSIGHLIVLLGSNEPSGRIPNVENPDIDYRGVFMGPSDKRSYSMNLVDGPSVADASNEIYGHENVLIHEFAHAIHFAMEGLERYQNNINAVLQAYNQLTNTPDIFVGAYIRTNVFEMFAVGSMIYLNGIKHDYLIDTRQKLQVEANFLYKVFDDIYHGYNMSSFCEPASNYTAVEQSTEIPTETMTNVFSTPTRSFPTSSGNIISSYYWSTILTLSIVLINTNYNYLLLSKKLFSS